MIFSPAKIVIPLTVGHFKCLELSKCPTMGSVWDISTLGALTHDFYTQIIIKLI